MVGLFKTVYSYVLSIAYPFLVIPPGRLYRNKYQTYHRIHVIQFLDRWIPLLTGTIIDLGAGDWSYSRQLVNQNCLYQTVDINPGVNVDIVCDIHQLHDCIAPGTVDAVICTDVLEHTREPWIAVKEIYSVLKPNGILLITVPFFYRIHKNDFVNDYWRFTPEGLHHLLSGYAKFNFVTIDSIGLPELPISLTAVARR